MAITHFFKGSSTVGYEYFAYIEDGQLVIGKDFDCDGDGGVLYRGTYKDSEKHLKMLAEQAPKLFSNIKKYFIKHETEKLLEKLSFDAETKTILFKVKLHKKNRVVHKVLVRGRFQADVIKKLMPPVPEVLTLQTPTGDVFAIRSDEISAVEFVDEFSTAIELQEV